MNAGRPVSVLPMFPLGNALLPHQVMSLHVFEPRYRALVEDCLAGDRRFGVVLIERGHEVAGPDGRRTDVSFDVGTVAEITDVAELPDGRWLLRVVGRERLHVRAWLPDDPYPRAEVEFLEEPAPGVAAPALRVTIAVRVDRVRSLLAELAGHEPPAASSSMPLDPDPATAAWEAALLAGLGPLDTYRLLAAPGPDERLRLLEALLTDREEILTLRLGMR